MMQQHKLSREEKQQETRTKLVEIGLISISENGYHGVSIRNICKDAGYTQGAFYANFQNKEDFLLFLMKTQFTKENQKLHTMVILPHNTIEDRLQALRIWLIDFFNNLEWLKISIELQLHAARDALFAKEYQAVWEIHQAEIGQLLCLFISPHRTTNPQNIKEIVFKINAFSYGLALQYMIFKDNVETYIDYLIQFLETELKLLK